MQDKFIKTNKRLVLLSNDTTKVIYADKKGREFVKHNGVMMPFIVDMFNKTNDRIFYGDILHKLRKTKDTAFFNNINKRVYIYEDHEQRQYVKIYGVWSQLTFRDPKKPNSVVHVFYKGSLIPYDKYIRILMKAYDSNKKKK